MSQSVRELAIAFPFKIDANGKVAATVDQRKIWEGRVKSVIGTALNSRVYRPNFGCKVVGVIFDGDFNINEEIESAISTAFQLHLPLLALIDVQVQIEQSSRAVLVDVEYEIPQQGSFIAQFGLAAIDGTNPITEEVAWQST